MARQVLDATTRFRAGIDAIEGVTITGAPDMSGDGAHHDRHPHRGRHRRIGDVMDDRGLHLDRQQGGLHLMLSPYHLEVADRFLADLADAVAEHGQSRGKAATYGGVA